MSYIKKIRSKLGHDKFIHPGARILIENEAGHILFLRKKPDGRLGIPAGGVEENETIETCIKREVKEETGLTIHTLEVIGISSNPITETTHYPNGDVIQYFVVEFYTNDWSGDLHIHDQDEVESVAFESIEKLQELPPCEISILESLRYYRTHGRVLVR